jgi:ubiquinol-cytochrome c reductase cytochrome b subunit
LKDQREADRRDAVLIDEGRKLLGGNTVRCSDCHQFHSEDPTATGPDLTGYGSREWLVAFLNSPASERFYGKTNDRMPAFGAGKRLTAQEIGLLADWLRGEWFTPTP